MQDITERKQALEALRTSEARLRTFMEAIPDLVWLKDIEGRFVFCNRRFARLFGLRDDEIVGKTDYDLVGKQKADQFRDNDLTAIEAGECRTEEVQITFADDGHREVAETIKVPQYDSAGQVVGVLGVARDITARKAAEEAVRYQNTLLNEMGSLAKIGAWEFNPLTGVGSWTDEVARIHGVDPRAEATFEIGMSFFQGDSLKKIKKATEEAITQNKPYDLELELLSAKGIRKWVRTIGHPRIEGGVVVQVRGSIQDITERKQAEAERERLLMAIEQAAETILTTSPDGIMLYVNPAFEKVSGYTREEAIGRHVRLVQSDAHTEEFYQSVLDTLSSGKTWTGQFINKRKDGELYTEDATISPVFDDSGTIVCHVAVKRDITHEQQLEHQLRQAQKMEAVGQLAGGIAHDFNNILQAISGYAQLMVDEARERGDCHDDLDEILRGAERATALTRQLLSFSRRQIMQPKTLDLNALIENLLKMLRRVLGADIHLEWLPGTHLGSIHADGGMMEQILMNLCVNARDAMHDGGGALTIETQNVLINSDYCASHAWARPGRFVLLSVTDTGTGMDTELLAHIFEPFFTTKSEGRGTGLGLATVYGIVKQHQGMIGAYSEPGKGSTFKVYLPICERKAEAVGSMVEGAVAGGTETILLAEDNEMVRKLGHTILQRAGYTVLEANDGTDAVELFKSHAGRIDLLLLDVVMPVMGGREAYEHIRALHPGIPTLFSSGYSENAIHTGFVLHDGLTLIQKPYSSSALLRAVRSVLDKSKQSPE